MRIIVSPAKRMRLDEDGIAALGLPEFVDDAQAILDWLRERDEDELTSIWSANRAIVEENIARLAKMDLKAHLTPAILAYDGIQYQYMAPSVFDDSQMAYVQKHLRILSGFYGVLKPLDGVVAYRLEMQANVRIAETSNLYEFWGDRIARAVAAGDGVILNLASVEYARCVLTYPELFERCVTCVFGHIEKDRVVQRATYAKMARGEMVRYASDIEADSPEQLKSFDRMGYRFDRDRSTDVTYVFVRDAGPDSQSRDCS